MVEMNDTKASKSSIITVVANGKDVPSVLGVPVNDTRIYEESISDCANASSRVDQSSGGVSFSAFRNFFMTAFSGGHQNIRMCGCGDDQSIVSSYNNGVAEPAIPVYDGRESVAGSSASVSSNATPRRRRPLAISSRQKFGCVARDDYGRPVVVTPRGQAGTDYDLTQQLSASASWSFSPDMSRSSLGSFDSEPGRNPPG